MHRHRASAGNCACVVAEHTVHAPGGVLRLKSNPLPLTTPALPRSKRLSCAYKLLPTSRRQPSRSQAHCPHGCWFGGASRSTAVHSLYVHCPSLCFTGRRWLCYLRAVSTTIHPDRFCWPGPVRPVPLVCSRLAFFSPWRSWLASDKTRRPSRGYTVHRSSNASRLCRITSALIASPDPIPPSPPPA